MASKADPYGRNVAPTRTTASTPMVGGEAFGAQIGEAIQEHAGRVMGDDVKNEGLRAQREYDYEQIDIMARKEKMRADNSLWINERRTNYDTYGAKGHADAVREKLAADRKAFLDPIKNPDLRKRAEADWDAMVDETIVKEDGFERLKTAEYTVKGLEATVQSMANRAAGSTPQEYAGMMEEFVTTEKPKGVNADTWAEFQRSGGQEVTYSFIGGRPPEEQIALLDSGLYNGLLTPPQIERLRNNAGVEIRRKEMEAAAVAREEKAQVVTRVDNIMRRFNDGFPISDEEDEFLRTAIPKYGLDKDGYDYAVISLERTAQRTYANFTPAQMQDQLNLLEAKGDKATTQEVVDRNYLRKELPRRSQSYASDPLSAGATMGHVIRPIDWSNPSTVRERQETAEAIAKDTGLPPTYLTNEDAAALKSEMGTPGGMLGVSKKLNLFSPQKAYMAAKQIAPNDPMFAASLRLSPKVRERVYEGSSKEAREQLTVPTDKAQAVWMRTGGPALSQMSNERRGEIYQLGIAIYRSHAIDQGLTEFNESLFENSIEAALEGSAGGQGGLGTWYGTSFVVPPGMTEKRFGAVVGSYQQIENPEYYPLGPTTGKRMNWAYLYQNYNPVLLPNGNYGWKRKNGNEWAMSNKNNVYEMDVIGRHETLTKRGK